MAIPIVADESRWPVRGTSISGVVIAAQPKPPAPALRQTEWGRAPFSPLSSKISPPPISSFANTIWNSISRGARSLLASNRLKLTETLEQGGATSLVDVRQAQQFVEEAAETIPQTEQAIAKKKIKSAYSLGENPAAVPRGRPMTEQPLPATVPGRLALPSPRAPPRHSRSRRALVAANARYRRGSRSTVSPDLADRQRWRGEHRPWKSLHLGYSYLDLDRRRNTAHLQRRQPARECPACEGTAATGLLTYEQTLQTAFREVADSLIAYQKFRDYREHQEALATAAQDAAHLSDIRYRGGVTSYLEVLTNDTTFFSAELNLARARLNERLALVQIYNALGGGWQQ